MSNLTLRWCAAIASGACASLASADMTFIWRCNSAGTTLTQYRDLLAVASNDIAGTAPVSPALSNVSYRYMFGDFTQSQTSLGYVYLTNLDGGGNNMVSITRYAANAGDPLGNLRTGTGGTTFSFSQNWSRNDDVYHDGTYFYRNTSGAHGSTGATRYATFADLMNNINGVGFTFGVTYGFNDRFFGFEGKIYRTNTSGPDGNMNGIATYDSFSHLVNGIVSSNQSSALYSWSNMFIAVPAPGVAALLGLAGLASRRERRR